MIEDADHWAPLYAQAGVFSTTIHFEAVSDPIATAKAIRETGSRVGLSIKPNTTVAEIEGLLEHFDQLLVMSVEPGFGGQAFMPASLEKISHLRKLVDSRNLSTWIQVDGGIDLATIGLAAAAGADTFVAGSAVFNSSDRNSMIAQLRAKAQAAVPSL
jgi:ribulose-phosphate 3-epimerase